jgi:hypothetical protein
MATAIIDIYSFANGPGKRPETKPNGGYASATLLPLPKNGGGQ